MNQSTILIDIDIYSYYDDSFTLFP